MMLSEFRSRLLAFSFNKLAISVSRPRYSGQQYEKYALQRFLKHFRIDCVFDVGANNGQYADLVRSLGYAGPIVSFEPIPELARALETRAARDGRWSVEPIALDETRRDVVFTIMKSTVFSSLKRPVAAEPDASIAVHNKPAQAISLTTERLETHFERYRRRLNFSRPFLKIDTQGADLAVARGAGEALKEFVGIQTELSLRPIYEDQPPIAETLGFLDAMGFSPSAFLPVHDHFPLLVEVDCIVVNRARIAARGR